MTEGSAVPHAVSVLLDEALLALNRTVGVLRRRNLPIESIAVGPAGAPGLARLTIILNSDEATVDTTVKKLRNLSGVRAAVTFPMDEGVTRELALVKVRARHERYAGLLDVIELFNADVVDEGADAVIVEVTGSGSFILAFIRAVEGFGILDLARSGSVALARATD
ncbi:MAG TPA: acetolactate synthase small subunit [Gemmatimonadales bacterium]|nr:acetolactate synthase small subunit [Gemmatimonadales bacterium]